MSTHGIILNMSATITIITGPTAIGKSAYALSHAEKSDAEIISADSMQVYHHMDIGTAKPSPEELRRVPHHLINIIDPDQPFSVADFVDRFKEVSDALDKNRKPYIIVGGTGLYLRALMEGFSFPKAKPDSAVRLSLEQEAKEKGSSWLHERLQTLDSVTAKRLHPNDRFRLIRALEVVLTTGKPLSEQQKKGEPLLKNYRLVCLTAPREVIYEKINHRVDQMFEQGLIEEVQKLLAMGYNKNLTALQALGYKETIAYLEGQYNKAALIELIKQKTRNFAKRQLTWFKSFNDVEYVEVAN